MPIARPFFNAAHAFQADPKPPPGPRDFLEFIARDVGGQFKATLRLHGNVATSPSGIDGWTSALEVNNPVALTNLQSVTFDPALTNTTCNGAVNVNTPFGVSTLEFDSGVSSVAHVPNMKRIRLRRPGVWKFAEHWTDLGSCTSAAGATYYNQATRVADGHTTLSSQGTSIAFLINLCGGGTYQHDNGDWLTRWDMLRANAGASILHSAAASSMHSWTNPGVGFDFSGLPESTDGFCGFLYAGGAAFIDLKSINLASYHLWEKSPSSVGSPGEWIVRPVAPWPWPDY